MNQAAVTGRLNRAGLEHFVTPRRVAVLRTLSAIYKAQGLLSARSAPPLREPLPRRGRVLVVAPAGRPALQGRPLGVSTRSPRLDDVAVGRRAGRCLDELGAGHSRICAGRPQTNGHVERLHRTILEECWRPAFARFHVPADTGLRRDLDAYITYYNHRHRAHTGRTTAGQCPAELVYGARKMEPR